MSINAIKRLVLASVRRAGYDVVKMPSGIAPASAPESLPVPDAQPVTATVEEAAPEGPTSLSEPALELAGRSEVSSEPKPSLPIPEPVNAADPYLRYWTAEQLAERPFLNLGAGSWRHPHWRNVEMMSEHYSADLRDNIDIHHDLMDTKPIPVPDNSIDAVFTSHTIEHLMTADVDRMFAEAYRVLRPGGIIRITCPSIECYYRAYRSGDGAWFPYAETVASFPLEHVFLTEFAGVLAMQYPAEHKKLSTEYIRETLATLPMGQALDELSSHMDRDVARKWPSAHKSWWTPDKVVTHLQRAGFEAYESGWAQSACPIMRDRDLFDTCVPWLSLFVEGVKGGHRRWDRVLDQ